MVSALHIVPFILLVTLTAWVGPFYFSPHLGLVFTVNESYKGSKVTMMNLAPSQSRPLCN